jgi:hypothetical protein
MHFSRTHNPRQFWHRNRSQKDLWFMKKQMFVRARVQGNKSSGMGHLLIGD